MTNGAHEDAAAALAQQAIPASMRSSLFTRLTEAVREREGEREDERRESRNATSPEPLRIRSPSSLTRMVMEEKARLDEDEEGEEAHDNEETNGGKSRFAHEPWDWKLRKNDEGHDEEEEVEVEAPAEAGGAAEEPEEAPASPLPERKSPVISIPDVPKSAPAESLVA